MLSKLLKNNTVKSLLYIAIICVIVQIITSMFFKINENFDIYESPLAPSVYPDTLLLEDTYNVNKSLKSKTISFTKSVTTSNRTLSRTKISFTGYSTKIRSGSTLAQIFL